MKLTTRDATRFWTRVRIQKWGCWEWQGGTTHDGYGLFRVGGKDGVHRGVHRVSFFMATGELPEVVMHDCDNSICVRPDHLLPGTVGENNEDMRRKGRAAPSMRRLRLDQIRRIRALFVEGKTKSAIAKEVGVGRAAVTSLLLGKTYKGVE